MINFREDPSYNNWVPAKPPILEADTMAAKPLDELQDVMPQVTEGFAEGPRQLASDFWYGLKEQAKLGDEYGGKDFITKGWGTIRSAGNMVHTVFTGTARVAGEIVAGMANPGDVTPIKSGFLQAIIGTNQLVPIPMQVEAMKERYGMGTSALVFPLMKGVEALGPFLFKGKFYVRGLEVTEKVAKAAEAIGQKVTRIGGTGPFETLIHGTTVEGVGIGGKTIDIPLGLKPFAKQVIMRPFSRTVSPTIDYLGGPAKWKEILMKSEEYPGGRTPEEIVKASELYVRKQIVQEKYAGEDLTKWGLEDWGKAIAEVKKDEMFKIYDRNGMAAEDFISQTAKWWEASDLGQKIKVKDVIAIEGKTVEELVGEYGKDYAKMFTDSLDDTGTKKPGVTNIVPGKPLSQDAISAAVKYVEDNLKAVDAKLSSGKIRADFINQFAEKNPAYTPFKPLLFEQYKTGGLDGLLDAVKNAQSLTEIKLKPGTESFNLAERIKQYGYFPREAPTQVKGLPWDVSQKLNPKATIYPTLEGTGSIVADEMSLLGKVISKSGLSPVGTTGEVSRTMRNIFNREIVGIGKYPGYLVTEKVGIVNKTKLYSTLMDVAHNKLKFSGILPNKTVSLVSGLSVRDIAEGLGVAMEVARSVKSAIRKSRNIPLEISGFGEKAVNLIRSTPGVGDLYSKMLNLTFYGRFQGPTAFGHAIRYGFKQTMLATMENPRVLPKILPKAFTRNVNKLLPDLSKIEVQFPKIFGGKGYRLPNFKRIIGEDINEKASAIMEEYFFNRTSKSFDIVSEADLTGSSYFKSVKDWRSHNWWLQKLGFEEKTVGTHLVIGFGKLRGLKGTQEEILAQVRNNPALYSEALEMMEGVIHYKEGYLSSPLAKTLNIAFYPSRFDSKITALTADFLTKQNPIVQTTVMKGMMDMILWAKSEDGQKWSKENWQLMNIMKNTIPFLSIAEMMEGAVKGDFADIGMMGGLPFGFITTILSEEGVIKNDYVNPETGRESFQTIPRGLNKQALILATMGLLRSFFPMPIYTYSWGKLHSPYNALTDYLEGNAGIDTKNYMRGPEYKPRPEHLFPDLPYPWNRMVQSLLHEDEEE